MSLRARLLIGLVALAAAGLAVMAIVTYEEQRTFLLTRVDQQVGQSRVPVIVSLGLIRPSNKGSRTTAGHKTLTLQTPGTYGELLDSRGRVIASHEFSYGESPSSPPAVGSSLPKSGVHATNLRVFTVNSQAGSRLQYRAAAFSLRGNRTLIVAVPLTDADQTLQRLTIVELSVGGGVVLALVAIGWLVVGLGLRPLERMRIVASEIAHGDLSQRVKPANERTEVGRLGDSLNEMLGQIEIAFEQRTRSEDHLRRFLADASHELRTPLASIRGYAELFRMGAADDPEALSRAMARIESEATRMGTLVEQLLLLANLDEVPAPTREQIDLALLVEQAAEDTRAIAPQRPVSVHGPQTLLMAASADQLRQVLANLTRNALMHTPAESAIELSTYRRGNDAVIEVRDHGPGLPDGSGELVFDRFWRAEPGRSRSSGGVGLGLAIVSAIVRAHHGQVEATNAPDGGAVFRVILPVGYVPTTANAG